MVEDRDEERSADYTDDAAEEQTGPDSEPRPSSEGGDEIPLASLRRRIEARRRAGDENVAGGSASEATGADATAPADGTRNPEDHFESVDVGDVDSEALWDAIVDEEPAPKPTPGGDAEPVDAEPVDIETDDTEPVDTTAVGDGDTADEHIVDKRELCQRCEYFSAPPEVACQHGGTEILELVDSEHFRVRNCPKVEEADEEEFGAGLTGK